jgi:hypothetical protein
MHMNKLAAIAFFLTVGLTVPAHATVWTFTGSGGSEASPLSFTSNGITITATGYNNGTPPTTANLYQSTNGLGVAGGTGPNEITDASFIVLNLSSIANNTILSLALYGVSGSNEFNVYQSTTATPTANPNGAGSNYTLIPGQGGPDTSSPFVFTKTSSDAYIALEVPTAGGSSSSFDAVSLSTVAPEPGYYGVLFMGLTGLGVAAYRRRQRLVAHAATDPSTAI